MATLSEMNEKQRVKEFKRIAKELKSKDVSVREGAIKIAFEEHAYLVEGKGLLSLLEGVAAKKVYLPFFSHPHSILLSISLHQYTHSSDLINLPPSDLINLSPSLLCLVRSIQSFHVVIHRKY